MPARAAADPVEREPMGLSPATAEALARSCRKSPSESPLLNDSPKPAFLQGSAGAASRFVLGRDCTRKSAFWLEFHGKL